MAHEKNHDYHILNPSIWPFIGSIAAFVMLFGAVVFFHSENPWRFIAGFVGVLFVITSLIGILQINPGIAWLGMFALTLVSGILTLLKKDS